MKKALIGTTALVAGGLIAGSALAADLIPAPAPEIVDDGFTVTWSGYIRSGIYFGDDDECSATQDPDGDGVFDFDRSCDPANGGPDVNPDNEHTTVPISAELQLFAEQTLAYGLRVGGEIDMDIDNGANDDMRVDELWIFLAGHFGQFRFGAKEGALSSLGGGSLPTWGALQGSMDGPDMSPVRTISSDLSSNEEIGNSDANKVTYLAPSIYGINFAASFTPDPDQEFGTEGRSTDVNGAGGPDRWVNEWSFGANTTQKWGDTSLHVAGGIAFADGEKNNTSRGDVVIWKVAGSIKHSWGGIGAHYSVADFDGTGATNNTDDETVTVWGVQANAIHGDYTIGGGYTHGEDDKFFGGNSDETSAWGGGVSKSLGTGTEVGVNFVYVNDDPGTQAGCNTGVASTANCDVDADGWLAGFFAAIAF
jgi:hypothetical protein